MHNHPSTVFHHLNSSSSQAQVSASGGGIGMGLVQFPEQEHLRCPRCDSTNTKFCYYNNYNLSQPRHFCKACRRYWTKGGALRNIPVGGGSRKNNSSSASKRSSSNGSGSKSTSPPTSKRVNSDRNPEASPSFQRSVQELAPPSPTEGDTRRESTAEITQDPPTTEIGLNAGHRGGSLSFNALYGGPSQNEQRQYSMSMMQTRGGGLVEDLNSRLDSTTSQCPNVSEDGTVEEEYLQSGEWDSGGGGGGGAWPDLAIFPRDSNYR